MKIIFSLLLSCALSNLAAQSINDTTVQTPKPVYNFTTAVSFNPLVLAGPDYTIMLGVEQRLQNNFALVLDAGFIVASSYFIDQAVKGASGLSVRPGIKYYTRDNKKFYLMMQVFYKQVNYKIYDWLGKSCVNEIPSYEQLQDFTYRKKTVSYNIIAGHLFRISDRIMFELYEGFGVRVKNQKPTEAKSCYRNNERGIFFSSFREHSVLPNLAAGLKLLIRIQ